MTVTETRPGGAHRATGQEQRFDVRRLLPLLLILVGVLGMSYPVTATYFRNAHQADIAEAYRKSTSTMTEQDRSEWLARAREYNENRAGGPILDPWLARVSKDNRPYEDYLEQLNPEGDESPFAAVAIPSIDVTLPIYHGTEPDVLTKGVGHLYGSALPVGGEGMHSVLTGHSGLVDATLFDNLGKVEIGEHFHVDVMGQTLTYEIDQIEVVLPEETELIQPEENRDLVTLITCTPYGINSHRLLVRGTRIESDPEAAQEAFAKGAGVWQAWMIGALAALFLALLVWLWLILRNRRRRRQERGAHALD
ncbi:class C sortase [Corynebacterium sp.]|uniref:class C sortase n=1 Tax=Corynebacterium sp. TaxID=1720 RepID=UPI0026DF8710|nr:class C sortase [Corynebacterium sp.]MDO5512741.1 class C sortase [Corynebacterium sp.]